MVIFIRAQWCGERGWKSRCAKKILTIDGRPCHFFLYVVKCVKWSFLRDSSLFKKNSVVFHAATSHVNFWKSFFFSKKNISHFIGNTPSYMEHTHEFTQNLTNAFAKSRRPSILVNWIFIFHSFQSTYSVDQVLLPITTTTTTALSIRLIAAGNAWFSSEQLFVLGT